MESGAQEVVYIYKKGDPLAKYGDDFVSDRIAYSQNSESPDLIERRVTGYLKCKRTVRECAEEIKSAHISGTVKAVSNHIKEQKYLDGELPASLLLSCSEIVEELHSEPTWKTVVIRSEECVNLKTTMKIVVNRFIESVKTNNNVDRRLTYDFDVLVDWQSSAPEPIERLIVFVEDTDSFPTDILNGLIGHMHSYIDLAPFHLVLNLSMPPVLLETKLTRENVAAIAPAYFSGFPKIDSFVYLCSSRLHLFSDALETYVVENARTIDEAANMLQYACLAHFTGNPFAGLHSGDPIPEDKLAVFKNLPSVLAAGEMDEPAKIMSRILTDLPAQGAGEELLVGAWGIREVFNPTYRPLLEATLIDGGAMCHTELLRRETTPLCTLYQLYRESSIFINIHDYYIAFRGLMDENTDADPRPDWPKHSMALFLEGIAALKLIGVLRDCKRKFECVEKVSWKGM